VVDEFLLLGHDAASATLKMKALLSFDALATDYIVTLLYSP
jgi:hypothetical protein